MKVKARVLICAATGTEAKACAAGVRKAGLTRDFEVLQTGVGLTHAKQALQERLRDESNRPELIVSSGFAGALRGDLPLLSWVVAKRIYLADPTMSRTVDVVNVTRIRGEIDSAKPCNLVSAMDLTVQSPEVAKMYRHLPEPLAVDMESAVIAEMAEEHGLGFMMLRMITDTPESPLPGFVSKFAAAMAERSISAKVGLSLSGMRRAFSEPKAMARMVKDGRQWAELLRQGWSRNAAPVLAFARSND